MSADLRLALPQNARALRQQPVARFLDVGDLVAEMVDAAIRIALEKGGDRRFVTEYAEDSILVLGSSMNTVVTPWAGWSTSPDT